MNDATTTIFYAAKGGSGTTVTAAAFAVVNSRDRATVLVSPDGPEVLGMAHPGTARQNLDVARTLQAEHLDERDLVLDAGLIRSGGALNLLPPGPRFLVTRPCFLSLRRALDLKDRPDGIVLVTEPGRSLNAADVADAIGKPIVAEIPTDVAVARAVDAGLLAVRLPKVLNGPVGRLQDAARRQAVTR